MSLDLTMLIYFLYLDALTTKIHVAGLQSRYTSRSNLAYCLTIDVDDSVTVAQHIDGQVVPLVIVVGLATQRHEHLVIGIESHLAVLKHYAEGISLE